MRNFLTSFEKNKWQRLAVQIVGAENAPATRLVTRSFNRLRNHAAPIRLIDHLQKVIKQSPPVFSKKAEVERIEYVFQQVEKRIQPA